MSQKHDHVHLANPIFSFQAKTGKSQVWLSSLEMEIEICILP